MHRLCCLFCFSVLLSLIFSTSITAQQTTPLQLGTPIERTLGPNEAHTYTITLEQGQYLQFVVDQHGIDVVVHVTGVDRKSLGDFDSPNGTDGPENVSIVAEATGTYIIGVEPLNRGGDIKPGKYEIRILELRKATEQELGAIVDKEALKSKAIGLVKDATLMIPQIHLISTRIHAQMQSATLLWDSDEKAASKLMNDAVASLKQYIASIDLTDPDAMQNMQPVQVLRYELIQSVANRDPEAALNLLRATRPSFETNGVTGNAASFQNSEEERMELTLASQISKKEPNRAFQLAEESLKSHISSSLFQTIIQLQNSDQPELANKLAKEIAAKVLDEQRLLRNREALDLAVNLVTSRGIGRRRGTNESRSTNTPLLPDEDRRSLMQKILSEALAPTAKNNTAGWNERESAVNALNALKNMGQDLETQVPGSLVSIEKRMTELQDTMDPQRAAWQRFQDAVNSGTPEAAAEAISKAPEEMRPQLYQQLADRASASGDVARAKQIINDRITNPWQRRQALNNLAQQSVYRYMAQGKVEEALRALLAISPARTRASVIAQIANRIGPGRKRAVAINLLEQARAMLGESPQADNQDEMNALLEIAAAFSQYDSKRSFDIVEPLVDQFNEISDAARKLSGFGMEVSQEGELVMYNGNVVVATGSQITKSLATLATIDIDRAKSAADRLQAPEVRLLAYLGIARQVLTPQNGSVWFGY